MKETPNGHYTTKEQPFGRRNNLKEFLLKGRYLIEKCLN